MTTPDYPAAVIRLKALAHPVRLQILDLLRAGEVCVCHIERVLDRRQAYISQQLMVLRDAGLVAARRDGLQAFYRLSDKATHAILDATLGPPVFDTHTILADCPCPACGAPQTSDIASAAIPITRSETIC